MNEQTPTCTSLHKVWVAIVRELGHEHKRAAGVARGERREVSQESLTE
jgi:hypothetical protein